MRIRLRPSAKLALLSGKCSGGSAVIAAKVMAVGSSGGLWRVSTAPGPACSNMCGGGGAGAGSLSSCGNDVWYQADNGTWVKATGIAGIKVRFSYLLKIKQGKRMAFDGTCCNEQENLTAR
jgi:hypothetical protein